MTDLVRDIHGVRALICAADGPTIASERDASDVLSVAFEQQAAIIAIPVARLADDFFRLSTRLAGQIAQKFVNYNRRLVILGDISGWTAQSKSLRDFVTEANQGRSIWFVSDIAGLERILLSQG
jgi:hypothetical protein